MISLSRALLAAALAFGLTLAPARADELPGESIYRVSAQLTDASGHEFAFAEAAGHVRMASMFYTSCGYVCPMLIEQIRRIEASLDEAERARLRVLLITVDPERDTPEALAALAKKRHIDTTRWTLAQPTPNELRKLAAVLDVQYRQLPDGEFNHSSVISLIDPQGRVLARTSALGDTLDADFLAALRKALAESDAG